VAKALQAQGFKTLSQYPSCGFRIDLVAEKNGQRLAIECDGEIWHQDEQGMLKVEDVQRQEILERAGWRVLRIPYRRWRIEPAGQISRVTRALLEMQDEGTPPPAGRAINQAEGATATSSISVDTNEAAILRAVRSGQHEREAVLNTARVHLGKSRMGAQIRRSLEAAIISLASRGLIVMEEAEVFASEEGRTATLSTYAPRVSTGRKRRFRTYRRWS
jgi:very-short-patch-repair endonuclease